MMNARSRAQVAVFLLGWWLFFFLPPGCVKGSVFYNNTVKIPWDLSGVALMLHHRVLGAPGSFLAKRRLQTWPGSRGPSCSSTVREVVASLSCPPLVTLNLFLAVCSGLASHQGGLRPN